MGIIEEFIARYTKEFDFYERAARLVKEKLDADLQSAGVRSYVTHRPKAIARLEAKCRQRAAEKDYKSVEDIFDDIVDLAGVRVALYFPGEREQVDKIVNRLFLLLEPRKEFPRKDEARPNRRFSGYSAVHYRVKLNEDLLPEPDKRYAAARVEIQVASVLMHAWSEVEHDLVYKPFAGDLSEDEIALIDQLNGLVHSGEISLERLQKAAERRIDETQRVFRNHFELAAHLLRHLGDMAGDQVNDSGLGRVDQLFDFLDRLQINTPEALRPYITVLHGDLESRSLAEQVVDAILDKDPSRYKIYRQVQMESRRSTDEDDLRGIHSRLGAFITRWTELERAIRQRVSPDQSTRPVGQLLRDAHIIEWLGHSLVAQVEQLRHDRNQIVHPKQYLDPLYLDDATNRLRAVMIEINKRTEGEP